MWILELFDGIGVGFTLGTVWGTGCGPWFEIGWGGLWFAASELFNWKFFNDLKLLRSFWNEM